MVISDADDGRSDLCNCGGRASEWCWLDACAGDV